MRTYLSLSGGYTSIDSKNRPSYPFCIIGAQIVNCSRNIFRLTNSVQRKRGFKQVFSIFILKIWINNGSMYSRRNYAVTAYIVLAILYSNTLCKHYNCGLSEAINLEWNFGNCS